jgi:hypothetical protein
MAVGGLEREGGGGRGGEGEKEEEDRRWELWCCAGAGF